MTGARLKISCALNGLDTLDGLSVETLVLAPFRDERPLRGAAGFCDWRLNGRISRLLLSGWFACKPREVLLMDTGNRIGPSSLFLFGQGQRMTMDLTSFRRSMDRILGTLQKAGRDSLAIDLPGVDPGPLAAPQAISTFMEAVLSAEDISRITLLAPHSRFCEFVGDCVGDDDRVELDAACGD